MMELKPRKSEAHAASPAQSRMNWLLQANLGSSQSQWVWTLIDQAVVSAAAFLTGIVIARMCGKEEFGLYLLGSTVLSLLTELHLVLIWSPFTVFSPRLAGLEHATYAGSSLVHQLSLSAVCALVLLGVGLFLTATAGLVGLAPVFCVLAVVGAFIFLREYGRRFCFAGLEMVSALKLDLLVSSLQVSGLFLLASLGFLSASWAFGVLGFSCGAVALGWLVRSRRNFAFSPPAIRSDLKRNWAFGKWVLGDNMAELLSFQLYPWILTFYYGAGAVGILAACQGVIALAKPFLQGTIHFLAPNAARAHAQGGLPELRRFVVKSTILISLTMSLFGGFMIVVGDQLLSLFYGPQYGNQALIVSILALDILFFSVQLGATYGIWAMGRPDINFKINLLLLALTVTLGLWLVRSLGVVGVALGMVVGNLMASLVRLMVFFRFFKE